VESSIAATVREASARTLVIVPTYNEIENLPRIAEAVFAAGGFHLLIVDDGSPDGTGELAEKLKLDHPGRFDVIHRTGKLGLGTAYVAGFRHALANGYDFVFQMDCDFSHDPRALPQLLAAVQNADVAIGSRYVAGGSTPGWPLLRRIMSRGGSLYAQLVLGVGIHDVTGGFRCFRRSALEAIDLGAFQVTGFGFQVELNYRCHQRGLKIVEVPITFVDRRVGTSKMSSDIFFEALTMVWKLRFSGDGRGGNRGN
jgi:dolichol-phosphate mannosyltransferase